MNNVNAQFKNGKNNIINSGNKIKQVNYLIHNEERKRKKKRILIELEHVQMKLDSCYEDMRTVDRILLSDRRDISECFVNLSIIETQHAKQFDGKLEFNKGVFDKFEDLFIYAKSFPIQELFNEGSETPKRILITGQAGVGKSVLSQYIACQWSGEEKLF
ncbi:hypothetical protein AKO1_001299, partial [Acrasis kona]